MTLARRDDFSRHRDVVNGGTGAATATRMTIRQELGILGIACIVISLSEGELDKDKLHETMAHPVQIGEAPEPGSA